MERALAKAAKAFVLVFDSGREVYTDVREFREGADATFASHLAGPMISSMHGYLSLLQEKWQCVRCGSSTLFVFTEREEMFFLAASSLGEDGPMLCRQLRHIQELLVLLFGASTFRTSSGTDFSKRAHRQLLRRVMETAKHTFSTDIAYSLMAVRSVPMQCRALDHYFVEKVGETSKTPS